MLSFVPTMTGVIFKDGDVQTSRSITNRIMRGNAR